MSGFVDDFNSEFDPLVMDELGDDVSFTDSLGAVFSIKGEFTEKFYLTEAETGVETVTPAIECLENEVANAKGGAIVYGGKSYSVKSVQPAGDGMVLLILRVV